MSDLTKKFENAHVHVDIYAYIQCITMIKYTSFYVLILSYVTVSEKA